MSEDDELGDRNRQAQGRPGLNKAVRLTQQQQLSNSEHVRSILRSLRRRRQVTYIMSPLLKMNVYLTNVVQDFCLVPIGTGPGSSVRAQVYARLSP